MIRPGPFGTKEVSRNVAAQASEVTGIDASLIKKALPLLAGLAMGALSKNSTASDPSESSLSDVFSSLTDGGLDIDDVVGLAKKFF